MALPFYYPTLEYLLCTKDFLYELKPDIFLALMQHEIYCQISSVLLKIPIFDYHASNHQLLR